jgi:hypothetical protein
MLPGSFTAGLAPFGIAIFWDQESCDCQPRNLEALRLCFVTPL